MFDFQQAPSRTGGTIARLIDLEDGSIQQVSFHAGSDNHGDSFLRIASAIVDPVRGVERFTMQYHMHGGAVPHLVDEVVALTANAQEAAWEARHAA